MAETSFSWVSVSTFWQYILWKWKASQEQGVANSNLDYEKLKLLVNCSIIDKADKPSADQRLAVARYI